MKFLKDNSYDIVKLFINQIGITIFATMLYLPFGTGDDKGFILSARMAVSVFATLFYLFLLYHAAWEFGSVDRMRSDSGKITLTKCKGLRMSLVANIPNYLLATVATVCIAVHMISGNKSLLVLFGVLNAIMRFLSSMYIGLLQWTFAALEADAVLYLFWQSVGYVVLPLVSVAVTQFGYSVGVRHIKLTSIFSAKKTK